MKFFFTEKERKEIIQLKDNKEFCPELIEEKIFKVKLSQIWKGSNARQKSIICAPRKYQRKLDFWFDFMLFK